MDFFKFCFHRNFSKESNEDDNDFDFSRIIEKYSLSHQENILFSIVLIQISYHPNYEFEYYLNKIIKSSPKMRSRNVSIDNESELIELNLYSLNSTRDIITPRINSDFLYCNDDINIIPFSRIAKNYVDTKILENELKPVECVFKVKSENNYKFKLMIYNIANRNVIYIVPVLDIMNVKLYNNINSLSHEILNKLQDNEKFISFFLNHYLNYCEKVVTGHLYTSNISVLLALYLQKMFVSNVYLYMFHPLLYKQDYLLNLFKSNIKYDIFSVDNYYNIPSLLHKKIIWIPEKCMKEYYHEQTCDCDIICGINHKIKKKKNIRSYVYTLFSRFPNIE